MKSILFLSQSQSVAAASQYADHVGSAGVDLDATSNPGVAKSGGATAFTFRAGDGGAHITIEKGGLIHHVDIARDFAQEMPLAQQAKIFTYGGDLWASIDTKARHGNSVYLMQLTPTVGRPLEIEYTGRMAVERNWGFYEHDGNLSAVHSVDPLRIIKIDGGKASGAGGDADPVGSLHVGSPPVLYGGHLYLMAHDRIPMRKWASAVLGRMCRIDLRAGSVEVSKCGIFHSMDDLLMGHPSRSGVKSLCYFSSLAISGGVATVGYGINDSGCGFADFNLSSIAFEPYESHGAVAPAPSIKPERLAAANNRASVRLPICNKCDSFRSGNDKIKTVSCKDCGCGNLSLRYGTCPRGKWPKPPA